MCDYCVEHGAGKKWYLEASNYMRNIRIDDKKRRKFTTDFIEHFMTVYESFEKTGKLNQVMKDANPNWFKKKAYSWYFKTKHSGQVIPKEEAKLVLDIAGQISLIPCVCRFANAGEKHNLCMMFMHIPDDFYGARRFDRIRDVESLTIEDAQTKIDEFAEKGYVQTVWTFLTPHIAAICNCDYPYCTAIRGRRHTGIKRNLYKAEFMAEINEDNCCACGECVSKCQFGAFSISQSHGTAIINSYDCFGCGVCREVCDYDAISLVARETHPIAADLW
jgi:NAD-dependent dihydropyrimidine dehydrogenase PreA subunit